jgi:hypothetical protein
MTLVLATFSGVALAQTAREIRGASPYNAIKDEAPAKLIVDPPIPESLAKGFVQIQYRVENAHIVPVFGAPALAVSPRIGHLHVTVDDLPWHWADTSDNNTVDIVGLPPGRHKILIELVDATHRVFSGQAVTVSFVIPDTAQPLQMH